MGQHTSEAQFISMQDAVIKGFGEAPPTLVRRLAAIFMQRVPANRAGSKQTAGEHWRQGQRDKPRDQNRHTDRNRKLAKQPAQNSAHEEHWNNDRYQRNSHRNNGKAYLARAT